MDKNTLINLVASKIDDKLDGDTILFVEQHIDHVIRKVCRDIVINELPARVYLVAEETGITVSTDSFDRLYADVESFNFIYDENRDRFIEVIINYSDASNFRMESVNNWEAFRYLPTVHDIPYYKIQGNRVYISIHKPLTAVDSIQITHYQYPTFAGIDASREDFPDNLIDFIINYFTTLIPNEYNKQKQEQVEKEQGLR